MLSTFIVCYVFWILLTWSLSPEELAAGAVVSFFVALFSAKYFIHENAGWLFRPDKFFALLAYFVVFLGLLIKSNLNVAKCCYKGCKDVYPGIVKIPTKLKGDYAQAMLANSITLTPGTITLDIIEENGETAYYVHASMCPSTRIRTSTTRTRTAKRSRCRSTGAARTPERTSKARWKNGSGGSGND